MHNRGKGKAGKGPPTAPRKGAAKLSRLYREDETGWLERMSALIEKRRYDALDYANLQEFLLDMAKRDRREVLSRLKILLVHLLKWEHQPRRRTAGWEHTIRDQREELQDLLESQTLKNHAAEVLSKAYARAVPRAAAETGLPEDTFPRECPYSIDELLSEE